MPRQIVRCRKQQLKKSKGLTSTAKNNVLKSEICSPAWSSCCSPILFEKLSKTVSEITVKSRKKASAQELKKRPCGSSYSELNHFPPKKRGRKVLLGMVLIARCRLMSAKQGKAEVQ